MNTLKKLLAIPLALVSISVYSAVLPMYYYQIDPGVKSDGFKLYQGVEPNILDDSTLELTSTRQIYFEPKVAEVVGTDYSISIGANCEAVKNELASEAILSRVNKDVISLLDEKETKIDKLIKDKAIYAGVCHEVSSKLLVANEILQEKESEYQEVLSETESAKESYQDCKMLSDETSCVQEKKTFIESYKQFKLVRQEKKLEKKNRQILMRKKGLTCASVERTNKVIEELVSSISKLKQSLAIFMEESNQQLELYASQVGGSAVAVISNQGVEQKIRLESLNPGFDFRPLQIKNVQFHLLTDPSERGQNVPRRTVLAVANLNTKSQKMVKGNQIPENETLLVGSGSIPIKVSLSRIGACSRDLVQSAKFFYEFDAFGYARGKAEYNKWMTYTKLEESKTKGGFLKSKAVHSLYEDIKSGVGFKFVAYGDTDEDMAREKERIQELLFHEIISNWTDAKLMSSGSSLLMPKVGKNGAQVLSDGLMKTCPTTTCYAAAIGLKTLNAIFGSSVSREEIRRNWNTVGTYDFGYTKKFKFSGSSAVNVRWNF